MSALQLPADLTPDQRAEIKDLNPGVDTYIIGSVPPGATPKADLSVETAGAWLDIAEGVLDAGGTILVPGIWGAVVAPLIHLGVGAWKNAISGRPVTERWTIAMILAEQAKIEDPKT